MKPHRKLETDRHAIHQENPTVQNSTDYMADYLNAIPPPSSRHTNNIRKVNNGANPPIHDPIQKPTESPASILVHGMQHVSRKNIHKGMKMTADVSGGEREEKER